MEYEIDFIQSLLLTISIETIVLLILAKTVFQSDNIPIYYLILTGIIASLTTLPYFWFILPIIIKSKLWFHIVSELTAIIVETFIISGFLRISLKKALFLSFCCNMISYLTGLLINLL